MKDSLKTRKGNELRCLSDFNIGRITANIDNYLWIQDIQLSKKDKRKLRKSLKTNEVVYAENSGTDKSFQKYFNDKLEDYSTNSLYKDLESILPAIEKFCIIQMKVDKISSDINVPNDISYKILNAIRKAIENNHYETLSALRQIFNGYIYERF